MTQSVVNCLSTPCGNIRVYKNEQLMTFTIRESRYNTWWIEDEFTHKKIQVKPDGAIEVNIDLIDVSIGDCIVCKIDTHCIKPDGGDENMINSIGVKNNYAIGIGTDDTDEYEEDFSEGQMIETINPTKRYLCYTSSHYKDGFEFIIVDNPKLYRDKKIRKQISIIVVWCSMKKKYAKEIVSCLSC